MKLKIFKNSLVQKLFDQVPDNIDRYRTGEFLTWTNLEYESDFIEIDIPDVLEINFDLLNERKGERVQDDVDSKIFFKQLESLPPNLARDPRLWATLCHLYVLPYIRMRNPDIFEEDLDEVTKVIQSRFFIVGGARGFERTNSLARLWWYGYICKKANLDFDKSVYALLKKTDIRASTIERPNLAVCSNYLSAITQVLIEYKESDDDFFNSRVYRLMFKSIFEIAGRSFFPSLDPSEIKLKIEGQILKYRKISEKS